MVDRSATIDVSRKLGAVPLLGGGAGSPCNNVAWDEAYLRTKWHLDPSSCLATTDMAEILEGAAPLGVELGSHLTQCCPGRIAYHRTKWHLDPSSRLATTNMGRKSGELCPLLGEGELRPTVHHLAQCGLE